MNNQAFAKNERLKILRIIYAESITYYKLNSNTKVNQKDNFNFTILRLYFKFKVAIKCSSFTNF